MFEGKTPAERNKTIAALVLGALALFFVARMLFGGSSPRGPRVVTGTGTRSTPQVTVNGQTPFDGDDAGLAGIVRPVDVNWSPQSGGREPNRNIFAYYVPTGGNRTGGPAIAVPPVEDIPTPTPTPPPPLNLSGLAPSNVFARTGDFKLDVTGDKFTPESRVYLDGQEVPTQFVSGQQLSANVPASMIVAPGGRSISVRTPDGQLYSNPATLNVAAPPPPPFTYVGLLGNARNSDKAILKQQQSTSDNPSGLLTVQRDDVVDRGRYRVTSISERAIDFLDTQLSVKHTLPYVESRATGGNNFSSQPSRYPGPPQPPPPPADGDDDKDGDDEPR
ncbi:MAG: IPT/TIG domain-containing protein [Pyrinomonadaceae bacterium]